MSDLRPTAEAVAVEAVAAAAVQPMSAAAADILAVGGAAAVVGVEAAAAAAAAWACGLKAGGCGGGYGTCWQWSPALGRWTNVCY